MSGPMGDAEKRLNNAIEEASALIGLGAVDQRRQQWLTAARELREAYAAYAAGQAGGGRAGALEEAAKLVQAEAGKIHALHEAKLRGEVKHAVSPNEAARLDSLAHAIRALLPPGEFIPTVSCAEVRRANREMMEPKAPAARASLTLEQAGLKGHRIGDAQLYNASQILPGDYPVMDQPDGGWIT